MKLNENKNQDIAMNNITQRMARLIYLSAV